MADSPDTAQLREMFDKAKSRVDELDEVINAASDAQGAGRRSLINRLVSENEESWSDLAKQIVEGFHDNPPQEKAGVYFGLIRELRKAFEEDATKYADEVVAANPPQKVDSSELEAAQKERDTLVAQMKPLKSILVIWDPTLEETLKVPRKRPSGGKRGARAISYYTWTNNGVAFEGSLTELAKSLGYEKAVELRDQMKAAKINLTKPPATIEFTTPAGNVLVGTRSPDAPDFDSEDSDNENESDEDDDDDEDDETVENVVENDDATL